MVRYFEEEYFKELEGRLNSDARWTESTKNFKTSFLLTVTDRSAAFLVEVDNGRTTAKSAELGSSAEFTFEGPYEVWMKVGKGELDFQSAVLKGSLRFRGSITKIIFYRERFLRIAEVIKEIPKEF